MKNCTVHDAVRIIKYNSFFKKLKFFNVVFRVYPINDQIGNYYVLIKDENQFVDTAYHVNVLKKMYEEVNFEETVEDIRNNQLVEFKVSAIRNKGKSYG